MRRLIIAVLALCVCSWGISKAIAGPGCCKKAGEAKVASASGCSKVDFPSMAMMVGDKTYQCPVEAKKAAETANGKIVYVVADKKFDCQDAAWTALADASEDYVNHFTMIACVVDGKVKYCGDEEKETKLIKASGCCKSGAKANLVKAEGGSCHSATVAKAEGSGCSKGAKSDGEYKSGAVVKSEGTGCTKGATVVKSEGSGCNKGATVVKSEGSGCNKGTTVVKAVATDEKGCCAKDKNTKFMVAGRTYDKIEDAQKASNEVLAVVNKIHMTYVVDGKEISDSDDVCPMAKKDGKVVYVVRDEKLKCEIAARVALAKAKYDAARNCAEKLAKI